ncbi:hypothetical protein [Virgisporangium aurantiacum]|nr:hypothetical protein [Virgisporangium aurantiacum]
MHEDLRVTWLTLEPGMTAEERLTNEGVDIVSHRSAARLLDLGDVDADVMEFTVPRRKQTRRTDVRLHRSSISTDDWALVAGLPTAKPHRVIADLAAIRIDRGHLATVVRDAVLKHDLAVSTAAAILAPHAWGYGAMTGDGQGLVTLLLREAGIPRNTVDIVARDAAMTIDLVEAVRRALAADPTEAVRHAIQNLTPPGPPSTRSDDG